MSDTNIDKDDLATQEMVAMLDSDSAKDKKQSDDNTDSLDDISLDDVSLDDLEGLDGIENLDDIESFDSEEIMNTLDDLPEANQDSSEIYNDEQSDSAMTDDIDLDDLEAMMDEISSDLSNDDADDTSIDVSDDETDADNLSSPKDELSDINLEDMDLDEIMLEAEAEGPTDMSEEEPSTSLATDDMPSPDELEDITNNLDGLTDSDIDEAMATEPKTLNETNESEEDSPAEDVNFDNIASEFEDPNEAIPEPDSLISNDDLDELDNALEQQTAEVDNLDIQDQNSEEALPDNLDQTASPNTQAMLDEIKAPTSVSEEQEGSENNDSFIHQASDAISTMEDSIAIDQSIQDVAVKVKDTALEATQIAIETSKQAQASAEQTQQAIEATFAAAERALEAAKKAGYNIDKQNLTSFPEEQIIEQIAALKEKNQHLKGVNESILTRIAELKD